VPALGPVGMPPDGPDGTEGAGEADGPVGTEGDGVGTVRLAGVVPLADVSTAGRLGGAAPHSGRF